MFPFGSCLNQDILDKGNEINVVDIFKLASEPLMKTFSLSKLLYVRGLPIKQLRNKRFKRQTMLGLV